MIAKSLLPILLLSFLLPACDRSDAGFEPELVSQSAAADAPSIGQAGSADEADRSCALVLREFSRLSDERGEYLQACDDEACHFVWEGELDASSQAIAEGASVAVLYHLHGASDWWRVEARPIGPGNPGFVRLRFRLDAHLPGPDWSEEALMATTIEFIPFLQNTDGARLFDHNRNPGDFDNYLARGDQGFYLGPEQSICNHRPDTAALRFGREWTQFPIGELKAGGALAIHYDLERMTDCSHAADWDVQAFVQVNHDGPLLSGSLLGRDAEGHVYAWPLLLDLPQDAERLTIWFVGSSGDCTTYDSDYGRNYVFELEATDPACVDVERWQDRYGGEPECPDYEIAGEFDANNCEFAVSGFGDGYEGHYGIPFRWLEAWLWVGENQGEVINAGLYVRYRDLSDATGGQRWVLGQRQADGAWRTGFNYLFSGYMGTGSYRYEIEDFAFFADVRRPSGEVERLWQSRQGANYAWNDAFELPTSTEYIPYGRIEWANADAALFDAYRNCR